MYKLKLPNTAKITQEEHFIIKLLDKEIIEGKYTKSTKEVRVYASDPKAAVTVLNYFFQRQNENSKNIDISKNESILDTIIVNDKEITLNYEYYLVKEEQEKEFELNTETDKLDALNDLISRDKSDKLKNLLIQSRRKVGCMEEWDSELKNELKNYFEKESKCTERISSLLDRIGSASHFRDSFEIENLEKKYIKGIHAFLMLLLEEVTFTDQYGRIFS